MVRVFFALFFTVFTIYVQNVVQQCKMVISADALAA